MKSNLKGEIKWVTSEIFIKVLINIRMIKTPLLVTSTRKSSLFLFSFENQPIFQLNKFFGHKKYAYTSIREITSVTSIKNKEVKGYDDIPGPRNLPLLGNFLRFSNPEEGLNPNIYLRRPSTFGKHMGTYSNLKFLVNIPSYGK